MSRDAENASDKTQHPFMIKISNKLGIEETYPNTIKVIHSQHHTKWRKAGSIASKI